MTTFQIPRALELPRNRPPAYWQDGPVDVGVGPDGRGKRRSAAVAQGNRRSVGYRLAGERSETVAGCKRQGGRGVDTAGAEQQGHNVGNLEAAARVCRSSRRFDAVCCRSRAETGGTKAAGAGLRTGEAAG